MGNSMSRPSCLGEKSPQCENFLKAPGLAARNNEEDRAGPLEKAVLSPRVIENGWNVALEGAGKGSPLPKQNNVDVKLQNCPPLKAQLVGAVTPWTSPKGSGSSWGWKPRTTREVTEVTEVTETVVTEIVEVTEYPGGDGSQEALVTRTVKALVDFRGALPEAAAFPGGGQSAGPAQEMVGKLLAWVSEVEDLVAHQKPLSGEARVVKAQLREQKLLLRLLEERMSHVERLSQGSQPPPAGPVGAAEGQEEPRGLASLREKWAILVQEAEARHSSLQQILPAANVFQESVDSFQDWLTFTEQMLAQLWRAHGSLAQTREAHRQIQARHGMDLCKDIQSKPAELEQALERGQHLWEMVPGEEAQLVQGKMDSLRMRLLIVGQRSSDVVQRLEQTLGASSPLDPAQEDLALWLERMEKGQSAPGGQPGESPRHLAPADRDKLEEGLRSELAAVAQLSSRLEELSQVPLNAQAIRSALAELKRLSAESLQHQGMAERLVGVAGPLLSSCPADIQKRFQPLVRPLQEHAEHLDRQSSACALRLERVHLLLAQHAEAQAELGPWLEEAQRTAEEVFTPGGVGREAFREQQEVLQRLREAIAEHKPLMAKLQRVTMQLAELCPQEAAPLRQSLQAAEEQHASLRERVQRAAAVLGEAIPRYSQLSERMELVAGCLERVQDRVRHPPALRGDPLWLQEQLWDSSLRLAELEELGVALETLRGQGAKLLATLQIAAHPAIQERVRELQNQWQVLWKQEEEREASLQEILALAGRFWPGLADLAGALRNAQQTVLDLEGAAASDPKDIRAKLVAMKALREEAEALQSELDSLGVWGTELMSSCGDLEEPAIAKSLDDLYSSWNSLNKMREERQNHPEDRPQALVTRQESREFGESWQQLLEWLDEAEAACANAAAAEHEDAEALLGQHKEFQKRLHVQRPVSEAALQRGRLLRAKAVLPADGQELDEMLREPKERWGALWSWAAERQRKLEEYLLFSGRFSDALQTLLDWLYRAEPQLAEETPVAGDRDLVGALMEKHKAFQKELGQRVVVVRALGCSVPELARGGSTAEARWLQVQMEELGHCWELIGRLSVSKQDRLEVALRQAEEFHRLVHSFLGRLSELEESVPEDGGLPEEQEVVAERQSRLKELQQSMQCQQLELECISSLGEEILSACHPDAVGTVQSWVAIAKDRFQQLRSRAQWQEQRLQAHVASRAADREEVERLRDWISAAQESLSLRDQEPLPEDAGQLAELRGQHTAFMRELHHKQPEVGKVTKSCRQRRTLEPGVAASFHKLSSGWHGASPAFPRPPPVPLDDPEPPSPLLAQLGHRWQRLWLAALDRQFRLQSSQQRLQELEELASFDLAVWRKRYLRWVSQRKSRVLDVFRGIDREQDGRVTQQEFIGRVLASKFPTSLPEMKMVAKIFDVNEDGFIDYYEFISALHPGRDMLRRAARVDRIQEESGESQQLRMVRILRSTLMVRVGGGWTALDEFLVKNDPCRVQGRTNLRINEKYLSPGLMGRKGAGSQSAPTSQVLSPSCSTSSLGRHSPASVPSSPVPRKAVLRRTRSGDRGLPSRSIRVTEGAGLTSDAGAAGPDAEPPDHPRRGPAPSGVAAP